VSRTVTVNFKPHGDERAELAVNMVGRTGATGTAGDVVKELDLAAGPRYNVKRTATRCSKNEYEVPTPRGRHDHSEVHRDADHDRQVEGLDRPPTAASPKSGKGVAYRDVSG
jgi:hypothetical protein